VDKLNYLTMTRLDIAYFISVVNQFLSAPRINHWDVIRILWYLKHAPAEDSCIWHDHQLTGDQLLIIVCMLKKILYRGRARSKLWFWDLVLSLNIEPWLIPHVNWS